MGNLYLFRVKGAKKVVPNRVEWGHGILYPPPPPTLLELRGKNISHFSPLHICVLLTGNCHGVYLCGFLLYRRADSQCLLNILRNLSCKYVFIFLSACTQDESSYNK